MEPDLSRFGTPAASPGVATSGRKEVKYGEVKSDIGPGLDLKMFEKLTALMGKMRGEADLFGKSYKTLVKEAAAFTKELERQGKLSKDIKSPKAGGSTTSSGVPFAGVNNTAKAATAGSVASGAYMSPGGGSGGGGSGGGGSGPPNVWSGGAGTPPSPGGTGGLSMAPVASALGGGGGGAGIMGMVPVIGPLMSMMTKMMDLYSSITKAGIQYSYNRIEGPTGNRNSALQMAQAVGSASTMTGVKIEDFANGLAHRTPVMGSFSDILAAVQGGGEVGAQLKGTPGRNGYFESLRDMQTITPGLPVGQMVGTLNSYMNNVGSQQRGAFYGGGAFTMMGQGGRYKSMAEWANAISKFLEEKRPGPQRGKPFTKEDLVAQNFPGSNINAWFQFMGVPENLIDYWWQYAVTKATGTGWSGANDDERMQNAVQTQRGMDLGHERLRNVTQGSRREFMMGTSMYPLYGARESSDRRFNVAMGSTDMYLAQMMRGTNMGTLMSMLPTPIMEMLLPMMTKVASSPIGMGASSLGMMASLFGDPMGDPIGDPTPVGDYGSYGGTSTSGLAPDLAKRIQAMQRANPNIKVTSGHRDSFLQGRLHKQGVGRVGKASQSLHTRGWAADLGPTSQLGWLQANAHKFGIQTAANVGEPWHAQVAGTMPIGRGKVQRVGDPTPIGDVRIPGTDISIPTSPGELAGSALSGIIEALLGPIADLLKGGFNLLEESDSTLMGGFFKKFLGGGTPIKIIDRMTEFYGKAMLTPLLGLSKLFGTQSQSVSDYTGIINNESPVQVSLPRYDGFKPGTITDNNPFGDPGFGMNSGRNATNIKSSPVVFNNTFQISGVGSAQDARQVATAIAGHLQTEMAMRGVREQ